MTTAMRSLLLWSAGGSQEGFEFPTKRDETRIGWPELDASAGIQAKVEQGLVHRRLVANLQVEPAIPHESAHVAAEVLQRG